MKKFIILLLILVSPLFSQNIILDEKFDENINEEWFIGEETNREGYIEDGVYYFKSLNSDYVVRSLVFVEDDFEENEVTIETKILFSPDDDDDKYSLILNMNNAGDDYYSAYVYENGDFRFTSSYGGKEYEISKNNFDFINGKDDPDHLIVKIYRNIITIDINGKNVLRYYDYYGAGYWCGFSLYNESAEIAAYYYKITYKKIEVNEVENPLVNIEKEYLVDVNSEYYESAPYISPDEKTLFFVREGHPNRFGDEDTQDIWYSESKDGKWQTPKLMEKPLNNKSHNLVISITPDNSTIFLSNLYDKNGNPDGQGLSISNLTDKGWEIPKPVNIINYLNQSDYVSYFLSNDREILICAIQTSESLGERDLFVSFKQSDGNYTKPMHMGNTINTPGEDYYPFLASDNKTLYFISSGFYGYGGDDVWVSKRLDDTWKNWSEPKNLGRGINTDKNERGFSIAANGRYAYMTTNLKNEGYKGSYDIIRVELSESAKPEPVVIVSGKVMDKKTGKPLSALIEYFDFNQKENKKNAVTNPINGEYRIILKRGSNYGFKSIADGYISVSENLDLSNLQEFKELNKDLYLVPVEVGQTIRLNNIFFDFGKASLREESLEELQNLNKVLLDNQDMIIEISGHTDNVGSEQNNLSLSQDRAQSVVNWLIENGIAKNRLSAKGYGKSKPVASNDNEEGRQLNRRVEFEIKNK